MSTTDAIKKLSAEQHQTQTDVRYLGVLYEEMRDDIKRIFEGLQPMSEVPVRLSNLESDMAEVKADIRIIKIAVSDLSRQNFQLDSRVTNLESA